jgi:hypothetical protein
MFIGNCPVPLSFWGYEVARRDLDKLQPMRKVFRQLQQEGLIKVHLRWHFLATE